MNEYEFGNSINLIGTFTAPEDGDAPYDPAEVACDVRDPHGTVTVYTDLENPSAGVYTLMVTPDTAGVFLYRFYSTTEPLASDTGVFRVLPLWRDKD